ncbi:MAG: hypothetical protein ABSG65_25955 [Bryobacteraceae bacterium]
MLAGCSVLLAMSAGALPGQAPVACVTTPPSVPCNLGTGQAPGTVNTASDPIWNIVPNPPNPLNQPFAPTGNTSGPAVLIGGQPIWGYAPTGLDWIATVPGPTSGGSQYNRGYYTYQATFSGDAGVLSLSVKADNSVCAYLNYGTPSAIQMQFPGPNAPCWGDPAGNSSTGWATFGTATIATGFLPVNTVTLLVFNDGAFTGLLVQGGFTPPDGYVEVCKSSSTTNPVPSTGIYSFTVTGSAFSSSTNPLMVPVGECSGPIQIATATATITELPVPGVGVSSITAAGYSPPPNSVKENLMESYDLQTRNATVLLVPPSTAGDTSTEALVTFTNYEAPPGQLKVCKIAGAGVAVDTPFDFTVNFGTGFDVEAGPLVQGGYCAVVPGTFQVGTSETVAEALSGGYAAPAITVNGASTPSAGCAPSPDCVAAVMGPGINEVSFTNSVPGQSQNMAPFSSLEIVNYSLVRQIAISATQSYMTYRANLLNTGTTAMGPITASVASLAPSSVQVMGQGALNFASAPGNSQATSSETFTVLTNPAVPFDASTLSWTYQSTRSMSPGR